MSILKKIYFGAVSFLRSGNNENKFVNFGSHFFAIAFFIYPIYHIYSLTVYLLEIDRYYSYNGELFQYQYDFIDFLIGIFILWPLGWLIARFLLKLEAKFGILKSNSN